MSKITSPYRDKELHIPTVYIFIFQNAQTLDCLCMLSRKSKKRGVGGIEPPTSCTRSRNHTTRPNSLSSYTVIDVAPIIRWGVSRPLMRESQPRNVEARTKYFGFMYQFDNTQESANMHSSLLSTGRGSAVQKGSVILLSHSWVWLSQERFGFSKA